MEVHEQHRAAALHHAPGRHRRVDAAREQRGHPARAADREAPGAPAACSNENRTRSFSTSTKSVSSGCVEVHARARGALDRGAQLALDLDRAQREALAGAARGTRKDAKERPRTASTTRRLERGEVERRFGGRREVRHAEDGRDALAERRLGHRPAASSEMRPASRRTRSSPRSAVARRRLSASLSTKKGAVAALERDLVVADDHLQGGVRRCAPRQAPGPGPRAGAD